MAFDTGVRGLTATSAAVASGREFSPAAKRSRWWTVARPFLIMVGIPTLLTGLYFGLVASDVFVSETRYAIRTGEQAPAAGLLATVLGPTATTRAGDDASIVRDYILARDMLDELDRRLDLRGHYTAATVDVLSRLWPDATEEEFLEYYRDKVEVELETGTDITVLRVRAFDAEMAQRIAGELIELSERLVNRMSERITDDTLRFARRELIQAETLVRDANQAITRFRNESRSIDPGKETSAVLSIVTTLEAQLAAAKAELLETESIMHAESVQVKTLQNRVAALTQQVESERARLASEGGSDLTRLIDGYAPLLLDQELAQHRYSSALASLEVARADAQRKQRYLIPFVKPALARRGDRAGTHHEHADCALCVQSDIRDRGADTGLHLRPHRAVKMPARSYGTRLPILLAAALLGAAPTHVTLAQSGTHDDASPAIASAPAGEAGEIRPFGEKLFEGGFQGEREDGLNPDYLVRPGDHITLKMWGAVDHADVVVVDAQGNIFVPDIGPIHVAGIRNEDLPTRVSQAVGTVFTQNVNVYTNLEGTNPVVVYVTGYVKAPGSYTGVSSDSLLYFLSRAGGVDPRQGSYRLVTVKRGEEILHEIDLYDFLLEGSLARLQFMDGDTIVVRPRGGTVEASGSVRNAYQFEISTDGVPGYQLMDMARPEAGVSHASVRGYRAGNPYSDYMPISEFRSKSVHDGDRVEFHIDQRRPTMMIRVSESHLGPSRYAVERGTTLLALLNNIEVDPELADTASIFLQRRSVARRQKQALEESLTRLETTVLGATSQTDAESAIRVQEAELIAKFVARARRTEPQGVLVVTRDGSVADLRLQQGDVVVIPKRSRVVLVSGEVIAPQALVHVPADGLEDYVARVGGYTDRADETRVMIRRRNGEVIQSDLDDGVGGVQIREGDELVIFPKVPVKNLQVASTISEILFRLAAITSTVLRLN